MKKPSQSGRAFALHVYIRPHGFERFGANALDIEEVIHGCKRSVLLTVHDNQAGFCAQYIGDFGELRLCRSIDIDPDTFRLGGHGRGS